MTNFKLSLSLSMVTLLAISSLANAGGDLIPVTPYNIEDAAMANYESQNTYVAPQPKPIIEEEYIAPAPQSINTEVEEEYIPSDPEEAIYDESEIEEEYIPPTPEPIYIESTLEEEVIDEPIYEEPVRVIIVKEPCPEEPVYVEPAPQPIVHEEEPIYVAPTPQPIVHEEPIYVAPTPQPIVHEEPVYVEPAPQHTLQKEPVYVAPTPEPIVIAPPVPPVVQPKNISANGLYAGLGITGAKYKDSCRCKNGKGSRDFKDTTYGAMARVGYDINKYIGVEARGSKTNWKSDGSKVEHGGIYVKPMLPVGNSANIYGLVGLAKTKVTSKNGKTPTVNADGLALGVGVELDLSKDIPRDGRYSRSFDGHGDQEKGLGLFVDYERMLVKKNAPDLDAVSAGVTYDF